MRERSIVFTVLAVFALAAAPAFGQFVPTDPASQGLMPLTPATEVMLDVVSDGLEGSNDIYFQSNGNVVIGWEDDPALIGAGIRLLDANLNVIPFPSGSWQDTNVASFYDDNGVPRHNDNAWGPKVKVSWFDDKIAHGATAYGLHGVDNPDGLIESLRDVSLEQGNTASGDIPAVQLFEADGTAIIPARSGVRDEDAEPEGDIRIADVALLANGNIAVAGESRQEAANQTELGTAEPNRTITLGILGPNDQFPPGVTRLPENTGRNSMWHGLASLSNGFVARFESPDGVALRYFDNNGNPTTGDILLNQFGEGDLAEVMGAGGRGDGEGIASNGNDKIVVITKTNVDGFDGNEVYAATFDTSGNLLAGPVLASEGNDFNNSDRVKAAIGPDGSFICVWDDNDILLGAARVTLGRIFNPDGTPATDIMALDDRFDISALDQPGDGEKPKVAWRGNKIGVLIQSSNRGEEPVGLAVRLFEYGEDSAVDDFMLY